MTERILMIETQITESTSPTSMIPSPRTPVERRGRVPALERRTTLETGAAATPVEVRIAPPTARALPAEGSTWVEHPLRHRVRAILGGRAPSVEQRHAAERAAAAAQLHRTDSIAAAARLFTGLR